MDFLLRRGSADCSRYVAISQRIQDVTALHGAGFRHVEYISASSARRNRALAAQPTQLVDELTRRRWFIV